jgi:SAM-dependent MidA family methyltransferase
VTAPDDRGRPELIESLAARIRAHGPLTFAAFMDAVLHDPEHGYYAAGPERLGTGGDFFTASDVGTAFGSCIARQLEEMDRVLGSPDPFVVVEHGAGRGLLARDVGEAITSAGGDLATRLRYVAVDRSPGMREEIARAVPGIEVVDPEEARCGPAAAGCVLGIELLDALPVHRVRRRGDALVEVHVDLDPTAARPKLVEVETTPAPGVAEEARRWGAAPADGDEAEVGLALAPCLRDLAAGVDRGFLVLVDYGHEATELYASHHRRGTLLAYHRHRTSEAYLARVGEQDLTAHVNWSAVDFHAAEAGWERVGRTTQDRFLIANGILERFDQGDEAARRDPRRARERLQAMQLIHPEGMGRRFQVSIHARGLAPTPTLAGLADPFAR